MQEPEEAGENKSKFAKGIVKMVQRDEASERANAVEETKKGESVSRKYVEV